MEDKPKRRRMNPQNDQVVDPDAWDVNGCSANVRYHTSFTETLVIEFWYDKHYWNRLHLGDREGERLGIDFEFVEPLVVKGYKYVSYYASKHKDFMFLNYPPKKTRALRVVLRQTFDKKDTLNIVVEYHFVSLDKIEVTIVTAMSTENFQLGDNQYAIEFKEDESVLYRLVNKKVIVIDNYLE